MAFLGGLVIGTFALGRAINGSGSQLSTIVLALPLLVSVILAVGIGYRHIYGAYRSLRQRERELERLQTEFIQNVNHELRQPLTLVWGYVEMLAENRLDEEEQSELSSRALAQTINLVERVEAITTFRDLCRHDMDFELVRIMDLAKTALRALKQRAHEAGVSLSLDGPDDLPVVTGDPSLLLKALKQLLGNAIKFSPEHGTVSTRVYATADDVYVEVADEGIGIPPSQLDRIFVPFCQADGSTSRRFGGVGLGLSIAQAVAEAHGGRILVSSEGEGSGSTFTLALPVRPSFQLAGRTLFRQSLSVGDNGKQTVRA
jgi:signal transduction histidine kinase